MALSLVRSTIPITSAEWTEGDITIAVSSSGSDLATMARPNKLISGDYSAQPFLTAAAALAAIPRGLRHNIIIRWGAGTFAGPTIHGFVGNGKLRLAGTSVVATITSGSASGTAGAGSTSTSMNKPTAAADWTVDDLRGKFLLIVSGGGASGDADFPTIRPIKSNTTTALGVDAIAGMDATTVFQIVDVATIFTTSAANPYNVAVRAGFIQNLARVEATLFKTVESTSSYGLLVWNCASTTINGVDLSASAGFAAGAISCDEVFISDMLLDGIYQPYNCGWADSYNVVIQTDGQINAKFVTNHNVTADALECAATAIKPQHVVAMTLGLNANDCDVPPLDAQNVHNFSLAGVGLIGTNATPTRGALFSKGGQYIVTGATISGSSGDQFELEGRAGSWAELSGVNSGSYGSRGSFLHWGTGYTVWQTKFRVEGGEPGDDFDELVVNNMVVGGLVKHYGGWQFLDPAYKQITAYAGGGQANATVIGYHNTVVTTVASAGDSIRLLDETIEVAYAGGLVGHVSNAGANACDLFPPVNNPTGTRRIYLNGITDQGADTALSIPVGVTAIWQTRNDLNYNVWLLANYSAGGGTGDVVGPASATDHALARYDLTTGKLLQNSLAILTDNGNLSITAVSNTTAITVVGHGTGNALNGTGGNGAFTGATGLVGVGGNGTAATGGAGVHGTGGTGGAQGGPGVKGTGTGNGIGVDGTGGATDGVGVQGNGGGTNGTGVKGNGVGTGAGVHGYGFGTGTGVLGEATNGGSNGVTAKSLFSGYALYVIADPTSPVRAAFHIDTQDAVPSGASVLGDGYIDSTGGYLRLCTTAGTPGTYENVIKGTVGATANAIPVADGTGTATLKASGVTIDSANGISGHTEVQNIQSGTTYTMAASDCGKVVIFTNGSPVTVTIPQTLTAGWHCRWEQQGGGQVSFNGSAVTPATLNNRQTHVKAAGQYAVGGLACYTSGTPAVVTLFGDTGT